MKIEVSVHAVNLKNVAGAFKGTSDPFVVATQIATSKGSHAKVLGKSEVIKNNLNPNWVKVFMVDYEFGTTCKVAFSIFDEIRKGDNKSMGAAVFDIAEVLGARGSTKGKKSQGWWHHFCERPQKHRIWRFANETKGRKTKERGRLLE